MPVPALADRVPAQLFIVGSALVQYVGAAIAVAAFAAIEPASVAWWRVATGAVVLMAWRRPWRDGLTRRDLAASLVFGVVLTALNSTFYEAIARLPLGTAVSLEFLGPVAVAVIRGRGWAPRVAAALAFAGVASIGGLGLDLSDPDTLVGVAWILAAAAMWAGYILLGQKIASTRSGITNLALGCAFGALVYAPVLGPGAMPALTSPRLFVIVVAVGLLSTVLPYSLEALAMARLSAPTFALFTAMLPATSAVVGAVMLRQTPGVGEVLGLVLISVAVWIASRPEPTG
ncbi:EamA family transporter [Actinomyces sp. B33]|uniref:EamA family transporter n=1 Tax=Actinomyces sp. B33 TaxID=2942131 RepID=UPI0023422A0F|nr:EamA family transporter [Actinomyces sp. B33]MDC4233484.1 EamA family transporter [Actinomyces sp. B33]